MKLKSVILPLLGLFVVTCGSIASEPANFQQAKKNAQVIWNDHRKTFYCGCKYNKHGIIDFKSCSYYADKHLSKRIGWEHVVPVSWYGKQLACWNEPICTSKNGKKFKGRKCCSKIDKNFKQMESDLHNLVPVIREVNLARKNYHFGEFYAEDEKEKYIYNNCNMIVDDYYRVVEPPDEVKGFIARIHFYMADRYGIKLSKKQNRLMMGWNDRFPPTEWEKHWNQKVQSESKVVEEGVHQ